MVYVRSPDEDKKLAELKAIVALTGHKNVLALLAHGDEFVRFPKALTEFNERSDNHKIRGVLHTSTHKVTRQNIFYAVDIHGEMNPLDLYVEAIHEATHLQWIKDHPYLDHVVTLDTRYLCARIDELNARHAEAVGFLEYHQMKPVQPDDMIHIIKDRSASVGTLGMAIGKVKNGKKPQKNFEDVAYIYQQVAQTEFSQEEMIRIKAQHFLYMMDEPFVDAYFYLDHHKSTEYAQNIYGDMKKFKENYRQAKPNLLKTMMVLPFSMGHAIHMLRQDDISTSFTSVLDQQTITDITQKLPRLTPQQQSLTHDLSRFNEKIRKAITQL